MSVYWKLYEPVAYSNVYADKAVNILLTLGATFGHMREIQSSSM